MRMRPPRFHDDDDDDDCSCRMPVERPPFLRQVQTDETARRYLFSPAKDKEFTIAVKQPLSDEARCDGGSMINVSVEGEGIRPRDLTRAIAFVESNEGEFIVSFFRSQPLRELGAIGDAEYQKLSADIDV
jgi:hypothetical protein